MSNKFIPLYCDDDILLIQQDTFQIRRLKELIEKEIRQKLNQDISNSEKDNKISIFTLFSTISINEQSISIREIKFYSIINCQLLKIGSKGWQKGSLRINVFASFAERKKSPKIDLEFFADEFENIEIPLETIKKALNHSS